MSACNAVNETALSIRRLSALLGPDWVGPEAVLPQDAWGISVRRAGCGAECGAPGKSLGEAVLEFRTRRYGAFCL